MDVIKRFCNTRDEKELLNLNIPIKLNQTQVIFELLDDPNFLKENCWKKETINYSLHNTNFHSNLMYSFTEKVKYDEEELDIEWFRKQSKYFKNKSLREILSLFFYTSLGSSIANSYLLNNKEECLKAVYDAYNYAIKKEIYFPLFFSILDIVYLSENNYILKKENETSINIIKTIKKRF
jgi:hypothetical protein